MGEFFPELMGMHFLLFVIATVWQLMTVFLMVFMLYSLFRYAVPCPRRTLVRGQRQDLWILPTALWKAGPALPVRWCDHGLCRLPATSAHVFQCRAVSISTHSAGWTTRLLQMCNVRITEHKSPIPKDSEESALAQSTEIWVSFHTPAQAQIS